jgi:hypothetical protein
MSPTGCGASFGVCTRNQIASTKHERQNQMKYSPLLIILLLTVAPNCIAQTLTNSKNDTSIILYQPNSALSIAQINISDQKYGLSYQSKPSMDIKKTKYRTILGFSANGEPSSKLARIIDGNKLTSGADMSLSINTSHILTKIIITPGKNQRVDFDLLSISTGINQQSATIFDPTKAFGEQLTDVNSTGKTLKINYNYERMRAIGNSPVRFGAGVSFIDGTNLNSLDKIDIKETQTFKSADGLTSRTTTSSISALTGQFKKVYKRSINIDLLYYPSIIKDSLEKKDSLAINLFYRNVSTSKNNPIIGTGFLVTQKGAPLVVRGGVNIFKDVDNKIKTEVIAGYKF